MSDAGQLGEGPILVIAAGESEILFFRSAAAAESYIEPIDLEDGEYEAAFEAEGRRLEMRVEREEAGWLFGFFKTTVEHVRIVPAAPEHAAPEEVKRRVVDYLRRVDPSLHFSEDLPLPELARIATERFATS